MKIISRISKIVPILFLVLGLQSCSDDDDNTTTTVPDPTIVELASATADLSSLVAALQAADGDLVNVLSGSGPFTVLAPTNAAFDAFLADNGFASLGDVPTDVLAQVLLNHVIGGTITSSTLVSNGSGYTNTSADGAGGNALSIFYDTSNGVTFNGVASVTDGGADITASNGIVHIVDAVIDLPTVVTFATADPTFSSLVASLVEADGSAANPMLVTTLSGDGPFTVFAPTNDAFTALLDSNPAWNTPADIDDALLNSVLLHHVLSGNTASGDLTDGIMPATLEGDMITINLPGNDGNPAKITDGAGNTDIDIIVVDVQANNGVIHAVETVLIPDTE